MKKTTLLSLMMILAVSSLIFAGMAFRDRMIDQSVNNSVVEVTIVVDFGGIRNPITYNGTFENGTTVFNITQLFFTVNYTVYNGLGILVTGIEHVYNNVNLSNYYWFYYVNSEFANMASNFYKIYQNSEISWVYDSYG